MSSFSSVAIKELLKRSDDDERKSLIIMPFLDPKAIIEDKSNSIDLRLGFEFITIRKGELATLDVEDRQLEATIGKFYERIYVRPGQKFVLHPRELVLGITLEYIRLPLDVLAYVIGRSSWGRLGLIIATATVIHPGFKGCITLELVNHGDIPIVLYPGCLICQLVLHEVQPPQKKPYEGKYSGLVGPTSPEFSKIYKDKDLRRWLPSSTKES